MSRTIGTARTARQSSSFVAISHSRTMPQTFHRRGVAAACTMIRSMRTIDTLPLAAQLNQSSLDGRVILITGAAGGIGKALSLACARAGATVVLHGRVVRKLEALYDEIVAAKLPEPTILPLDFARAEASRFRQRRPCAGRTAWPPGRARAYGGAARVSWSARAPIVRQLGRALARQCCGADGTHAHRHAAVGTLARCECRIHARQPWPGAARVLGRLRRNESCGRRTRPRACRRVGASIEPARQRRHPRPDPLAAAQPVAPG